MTHGLKKLFQFFTSTSYIEMQKEDMQNILITEHISYKNLKS